MGRESRKRRRSRRRAKRFGSQETRRDGRIRPSRRTKSGFCRSRAGQLMTDLKQTIASDLATRYKKLAGVVRELAAPLSEEQFWARPFPLCNSFCHLVLHLTRNLNYYI